jgi:soluble lytic murein transglycosylase-like protein
MLNKILTVAMCTLLTASIANAVTIEPTTVTTIEVKKPMSISEKIDKYANQYGVNSQLMRDVVFCESGLNPNAVGDNGHSRGLVQIYDDYHPTISHEQAFDPDFALNFLAREMSQGNGHLWTCYRKLTQ